MLVHLQEYIDAHPTGDIFIVLHQMGNHGPAYYKRYPAEFEKFMPACKTSQLLRSNNAQFEAAMLYVSDHGESLGENGIYLHGLPILFAPKTQTHVPVLMWFSDSFDPNETDIPRLKASRHDPFTHDAVFHTILGLLEVETDIYQPTLDLISRG
jgi:lipid A ethanolaminephosphotransferase